MYHCSFAGYVSVMQQMNVFGHHSLIHFFNFFLYWLSVLVLEEPFLATAVVLYILCIEFRLSWL